MGRARRSSTELSSTMMYDMTYGQHQLVYNATSFTLASMMATTAFLWIRIWGVHESLRTALCITGLVTFIAFYHYVRIFNSWVGAYKFPEGSSGEDKAPALTGEPFTEGPQLSSRWMFWGAAMVPFGYIVYMLLKGLDAAMKAEEQKDNARAVKIAPMIRTAQLMTVVSWCTYPIVYVFPMIGFSGAGAIVGVQIGYCVSDIISKCGVGLMTYKICAAKSQNYQEM